MKFKKLILLSLVVSATSMTTSQTMAKDNYLLGCLKAKSRLCDIYESLGGNFWSCFNTSACWKNAESKGIESIYD